MTVKIEVLIPSTPPKGKVWKQAGQVYSTLCHNGYMVPIELVDAPAAPVGYCECEYEGWTHAAKYKQIMSDLQSGLPCLDCGKYHNPTWTWHLGDPLPNVLPKGCEYEEGENGWITEPDEPKYWGTLSRRWSIALNPTVFDAVEDEPVCRACCGKGGWFMKPDSSTSQAWASCPLCQPDADEPDPAALDAGEPVKYESWIASSILSMSREWSAIEQLQRAVGELRAREARAACRALTKEQTDEG